MHQGPLGKIHGLQMVNDEETHQLVTFGSSAWPLWLPQLYGQCPTMGTLWCRYAEVLNGR